MTAKPQQTQALEVVSHALTGTLDEKVRAFEQMAGAMAQIQLNGFDSVQKCKAGFWLADGIGEHPAVFVQNHYIMQIKGRLTIEPKWEYMVRKLTETVPKFTFEVLEEGDERATVKMGDGVNEHVVTYSVEDARRQGLMGRGENAWTTGSTREMCFKQAVKRCARRLGVGRATPWVEMQMDEYAEAEQERDTKAEVEREVSGAVVEDGGGSPPESSEPKASASARRDEPNEAGHAPPSKPTSGNGGGGENTGPSGAGRPGSQSGIAAPSERPAVMRLSDALVKMYGKQPKGVMLEKATFIYNEMVKANTGTNPGTVFKKVEDIGPVDADLMIEFLENRNNEPEDVVPGTRFGDPITKAAGASPPSEPGTTGPAPTPMASGSGSPAIAEDEPPPAEGAELEESGDEYEHFMMAVKRAKKVTGRKILVEAPQGSKKFWFVDTATFSQAGYTASVKIMVGDEVVLGVNELWQLTKIMQKDCDAAERGRA